MRSSTGWYKCATTALTHHHPDGLHQHPAFSQAVEVEPGTAIVFIGGQNGVDATGNVVSDDASAQTTQALENVRVAVEAAGGSIADIAKWAVLLTDREYLEAGFAAFATFWDTAIAPPAITVQVVSALAPPGLPRRDRSDRRHITVRAPRAWLGGRLDLGGGEGRSPTFAAGNSSR